MSLPPSRDSPVDNDQSQPQLQQQQQQAQQNEKKKEIKTFHCRYCSHLLLASTRAILSPTAPLARRGGGARDRALILDIHVPTRRQAPQPEVDEGEETGTAGTGGATTTTTSTSMSTTQPTDSSAGTMQTEEKEEEAHYTIPLSTLVPDSKPVIIRRDDGFEKRVLLRCGRCRVVVGYEVVSPQTKKTGHPEHKGVDEKEEEEGKVIYLLPGSLVGTEDLQGEIGDGNPVVKQMDAEWGEWVAV